MVVLVMPAPRLPGLARVRGDLVVALVPAVVTLVVFAATLGHGWVDVDDNENFLDNPHYRGLGPAQLRWMLTGVIMGHWTPVTWLTHGLDYVLWGMNPAGYHLGNLLLHAANAALFALLARRLLGAALPGAGATPLGLGAVAAALMFAAHPLRGSTCSPRWPGCGRARPRGGSAAAGTWRRSRCSRSACSRSR
jgi:hypothetical protein